MSKLPIIALSYLWLMCSAADAAPLVPMSTIVNGASMQVHDYHCTCRKVSNSTGKSVMIPWGRSAEWSSFIAAAVAGLTKNSCVGEVPGHPPISGLPDLTVAPGGCGPLTTGPINISNVKNSGGYTLNVNIPSLVGQGCSASATVKNGNATPAYYIFVDGNNPVTVCENSVLTINFDCNGGPSDTIQIYRSDMGLLDDFLVDFTGGNGACF